MSKTVKRSYLGRDFCIHVTILDSTLGVFGNVSMDVKGQSIGPHSEPVFVLPFHNALLSAVHPNANLPDRLFVESGERLWRELCNSNSPHRFPSTEGFDDYDIYVFNNGVKTRFLWLCLGSDISTLGDEIISSSTLESVFWEFHDDLFQDS